MEDQPGLNLGWNLPYAALAGVTLTLERHGDARGIESTMVELRNDEIITPSGVARWAGHLAKGLSGAYRRRRPLARLNAPQRLGWSLSA